MADFSDAFGRAEPRLYPAPLRDLDSPGASDGPAFIAWCREVLKWNPMPWQEWLAKHALELREDGSYRWRRVIVLVGRQSGKTAFVAALAVWRLANDPTARTVVGAAQLLYTARKCFDQAWTFGKEAGLYIDRELSKELDVPANAKYYSTNGRERYTLAASGDQPSASYHILALNRRARGDSVDLLLLDELREQQNWEGWSAVSKMANARLRGQLIAISNAGKQDAVVLNHFVTRGRAIIEEGDTESDLGLFEWSGEDECSLTSIPDLLQGCPAIGYTTDLRTILNQARDEPPDVVRTELLCQPALSNDVVDMDAWRTTADPHGPTLAGRKNLILALEVSGDQEHATLVAAAPVDKHGFVRIEVVHAWTEAIGGVEMRKQLREIVARARPRAVVYSSHGPAVALVPDLRRACRRSGVRPPAPIRALPAACVSLDTMIRTRRVLHLGEPLLEGQLLGAVRKPTGNLWVYDRSGQAHADAVLAAAEAVGTALLDTSGEQRDEGGPADDVAEPQQ